MQNYIEVKREFVNVCSVQGSPTLDEVKEYCIDLIAVAFTYIPQGAHHAASIKEAETMTTLAYIMCFDLSNWINYDFFKKVIAYFQPGLERVKVQLMHYEDQLKPFLLQELEDIAELQQR